MMIMAFREQSQTECILLSILKFLFGKLWAATIAHDFSLMCVFVFGVLVKNVGKFRIAVQPFFALLEKE